ncbi:MAG: BamA/TamA family outer membrane protein [Flavobacteriales bacterium]|nr:BamA/TamA family outer membrane protein [Flavobacteriales bacterium]
MLRSTIVVLLCACGFTSSAQVDSTASKRKAKFLALPGVFSSPETSLGFGVVGLTTFRFKNESDSSQTSQINIGAAYTLLDQFLLYLPYQFFWNEQRYKLYGEVGYYKYFFLFHGIGADHEGENLESFDVRFPRVRINFLKRFGDRTFVGGRYAFDNFNITRFDTTGVLQDLRIAGTAGGAISGLGPIVNYDTRDNIFQPYKGILAELSFLLNDEAIGSAYNFTQTSLEVSGYIALKKPKALPANRRPIRPVLALNMLAVAAGGNAPFNALGLLGGTKRMRGYYEGYFRDKRMIEGQAEVRIPLFANNAGFLQRFGVVAFGGLGTVAPTYKSLNLQDIVHTYGGGLRFQLDRKQGINLRVEYGLSATTSGFYLSIGEAF